MNEDGEFDTPDPSEYGTWVPSIPALAEKGLEVLFDGSYAANGLCEVRPQEIFCTLNRYRK